MSKRKDMSQKQFNNACKRHGFKSVGFMGYYIMPADSDTHVSKWNIGDNRRNQLKYLLQQNERIENEKIKMDRMGDYGKLLNASIDCVQSLRNKLSENLVSIMNFEFLKSVLLGHVSRLDSHIVNYVPHIFYEIEKQQNEIRVIKFDDKNLNVLLDEFEQNLLYAKNEIERIRNEEKKARLAQ